MMWLVANANYGAGILICRTRPQLVGHRGLLVRISGCKACFVTRNREMKIELIKRAEYGLGAAGEFRPPMPDLNIVRTPICQAEPDPLPAYDGFFFQVLRLQLCAAIY